jgi:hypothetical protein
MNVAVPAPIIRTPALDEVMGEVVAGLAAVAHRAEIGAPVAAAERVAADVDADRIQHYLGVTYTGPFDGMWAWTIDQARAAGLG